MPQTECIIEADNKVISNIFGQFDSNISKIEKELSVRIVNRSEGIKIVGEENDAERRNRLSERWWRQRLKEKQYRRRILNIW